MVTIEGLRKENAGQVKNLHVIADTGVDNIPPSAIGKVEDVKTVGRRCTIFLQLHYDGKFGGNVHRHELGLQKFKNHFRLIGAPLSC